MCPAKLHRQVKASKYTMYLFVPRGVGTLVTQTPALICFIICPWVGDDGFVSELLAPCYRVIRKSRDVPTPLHVGPSACNVQPVDPILC